MRCRRSPQRSGAAGRPKRSQTNRCTTFQFQLATRSPPSIGCAARGEPPVCGYLGPVGRPRPVQRRRRGRCPPALGQQQDGVPPLPLPCRNPSTQILDRCSRSSSTPPTPNYCTLWPSSSTNLSRISPRLWFSSRFRPGTTTALRLPRPVSPRAGSDLLRVQTGCAG